MIRRMAIVITVMAVMLSLAAAAPALADDAGLAGEYEVKGWEPGTDKSGKPDYHGTVTLLAWGDAWKYKGFIDGQQYTGVGIYDAKCRKLSLSFINGDMTESGVTVLKHSKGVLKGEWVFVGFGDGRLATEIWIKKK